MANHISAQKRVRITKRRTTINRLRKTKLRNQIRAMRRLVDGDDKSAAQAMLPKTFSMVDKAAKWGVIKKNTAARYKSRLAHRLTAAAA